MAGPDSLEMTTSYPSSFRRRRAEGMSGRYFWQSVRAPGSRPMNVSVILWELKGSPTAAGFHACVKMSA